MARSRKSAIGLGLRILLWPLLVLALVIASLGMRLAAGPVDVPIPERLLGAFMARAAPGWTMAASGARFDLFGRDGLTGLTLRDVRLRDADGAEATAIPELGLTLALSPSRRAGEAVRVKGVRIEGARVAVERGAGGGLVFGLGDLFGGGAGGGDGLSLDSLFAATGESSPLPVIALSDVHLDYRDPARGIAMAAHGSSVVFDPAGTIRLDGSIDTGEGSPMPLDLEATRLEDGGFALDMVFDDVRPPALAALDPVLAPLDALRMTMRGSARATLARDGSVTGASATLRAAKGGAVVMGGHPRTVGRLAVDIAYAPDALRADFHEIALAEGGLTLTASARVARAQAGGWTIAAQAPEAAYAAPDGSGTLHSGPVSVEARLSAGRVTVERLTVAAPRLRADGGRAGARSLTLAGRIDPDTRTARLSSVTVDGFEADTGETVLRAARMTGAATLGPDALTLRDWALEDGAIRAPDADATVQAVRGAMRLDRRDGRMRLDDLAFESLHLAMARGNAVSFPALAMRGTVDTRKGRAAMTGIRAPRATLALPGQYEAPLIVADLALSLDADARSVDLHGIGARLGGIPVEGRIRAGRAGKATKARIEMKVARIDPRRIVALWPEGTLKGARRWIADNVRSGTITDIALDTRVDTADRAANALALTFGFAEGHVRVIPGMPPLRRARGRGKVSLDRLDIFLDSARVAVPGTPGYALGESRFSIADFSPAIPVGLIELDVDGPARAILRFLDLDPLALVSRSGIDIAKVAGQVSGTVQVRLPLKGRLAPADVAFKANATVRAFSLFEPHIGARITGDVLSVAVSPSGLKFRADARIDGLSTRLTYEHGFSKPASGKPEGALTLQSYLTREDFARRAGLDVSRYFDGVAVLDARVDLFPDGGAGFAVDADLTGSTLRIGRLGWVKTDGVPVTVEATGFRRPDGTGRIGRIAVRGSGITARGRMDFGPGGRVGPVDLERIVLADLLDAGIRYHGATATTPRRIEIDGAYLDLGRPFSDAMDARGRRGAALPHGRGTGGPLTEIALRLASVRLRDGLRIADLDGGIRLDGERVMAANLAGRLNGIAPARILAERHPDGLSMRLTARDAGAFLGAASVFEGAGGGTLRIDARTRDDALPMRIAGVARANGITIRDSPTLRRILSGGAFGSLAQQMLAGGLTFDKVELPFSATGARWSIAEGVAWGDALGLTLDGAYDIGRGDIDLTGTISPAYAINGALGSVPLLGALLTGGEGEGMFGITFAVRGTADAPRVWVNPLSAIAPGFLRKIVSAVMDGGHTVDTDPARPSPLRAAER